MSNEQLAGRPNFVYILVVDLGYRDVDLQVTGLEVLRSPHIKTPRLAELASESLVLTDHYSPFDSSYNLR